MKMSGYEEDIIKVRTEMAYKEMQAEHEERMSRMLHIKPKLKIGDLIAEHPFIFTISTTPIIMCIASMITG